MKLVMIFALQYLFAGVRDLWAVLSRSTGIIFMIGGTKDISAVWPRQERFDGCHPACIDLAWLACCNKSQFSAVQRASSVT
jgi:hypothetical protein